MTLLARDQFDQLTNHLHFNHVEEGAPHPRNKMWKLQSVVDALNNSSGAGISIDESLKKFHFQDLQPTCCHVSYLLQVHGKNAVGTAQLNRRMDDGGYCSNKMELLVLQWKDHNTGLLIQ